MNPRTARLRWNVARNQILWGGVSRAVRMPTRFDTDLRFTGGTPFLGTDLRNDHPITIIYETARAATPTEFNTQAITGTKITVGTVGPLPLYGSSTATATVECASCHNPHSNAQGSFLRKSNAGSAICLTCHIK